MVCADIHDRGLLESYVAGQLDGPEREAVEVHVFECDACFDDLRTLRAVRDELARERGVPRASMVRVWAPALALAATIIAAVWIWTDRSVPASRPVSAAPPPVAVARAEPPQPAAPPARESLIEIARVEPPAYTPFTLRNADGSTQIFDRAMDAYAAKQFDRAADGLRRVITGDPGNVTANFYLAVSLLMTDDVAEAIDRLHAVIDAGDSPFRQTAGVLLAKGLIRTGDLDGATRELESASRGTGGRAQEAKDLLGRLAAARGGDRARD